MTIIINPGSGAIPAAGNGWTNTYEQAEKHAREWRDRMTADGIRDVTLELPGADPDGDGRWRFSFRHDVTGMTVYLDTHGIDDWRAYEKQRIFSARVYWNGDSSGEPQVEDWAADGFEVVKTYRPTATEGNP